MKFLFRGVAALSVLGSVLVGSMAVNVQRALALDTAVVVEQLSTVPVFILVDETGNPLLASDENQETPLVFMERQGAEAFIAAAEEEGNSEFSDDAQIAVIWLGDLYSQTTDEIQNRENGTADRELSLDFVYIPSFSQQRIAVEFDENFEGVPLFVVRFNDDQTLLTVNVSNEEEAIIPMFFQLQDMQPLLDRLESQGLADQVSVTLLSLEAVLDTLEETSDTSYAQIRFFPSSEVVTDIFGDGENLSE
ncbi:MAG: Tic22 family protein [Cyanobacteria bacterium P01_A01_bin.123]